VYKRKDVKKLPLTDSLTSKQKKYLVSRLAGNNKRQAVKNAGYDSTTNSYHVEKSVGLKNALISSFDLYGLTTNKIAMKIAKGVDAKKTHVFTHKGKIEDKLTLPDNETQHKYVRTALEVRGDLETHNQTEVNVGLISVPESKGLNEWSASKNGCTPK